VTRGKSGVEKTLAVSLKFAKSSDSKLAARVDKGEAMNRNVSINLTVKKFPIYLEKDMNFSSLLGITDIEFVS
jgi:hypothetical protein